MTKPMTPELPAEMPTLQGPGGALAHAGPASSAPFSLTGRRATAWGTETRGLEEVRAGGWTLLSGLHAELGPASGIVVGPSSVRREVLGGGGSALETILMPLELPGAVVQWSRPAGAHARLAVRVEWSIARPGANAISHEPLENGVRVGVSGTAEGERATALALVHPRPTRLEVRAEADGLRIAVDVESDAAAPVTLLLVGEESAEAAVRALRSLTSLSVQERRAEQATVQARQEKLATRGAGPLDDALEWSKARTRAAVAGERGVRRLRRGGAACGADAGDVREAGLNERSPFAPGADAAWLALGALAAGDHEPAEVLLEGEQPRGHELLVGARYAAWSGRATALHRHRSAAEALGLALSESGSPDPLLRAAARELADAWEAADLTFAKRLRAAASTAPRRPGVRTLPMAARPGAREGDGDRRSLLRALFDENPVRYLEEDERPTRGVEAALRAWALCRAGDPDEGHQRLMAYASAGFERGAGVWPERLSQPSGCADHAASAALLGAALLFGALGGAADAAVGRLRLAPRLPAAWNDLSVTGIRVGDASVRLDCRRSGPEHRFAVSQETGRIPLMLIFEPEVSETELLEVQVDGSPAELECSSRAGWSRTRVQLPLDAPRIVTMRGRREPL